MKVSLSSLVNHNIITPTEKKALEAGAFRLSIKEKKGEIIAKAKADGRLDGIKKCAIRVVKDKKDSLKIKESKGIQKLRKKLDVEFSLEKITGIIHRVIDHYKELKK